MLDRTALAALLASAGDTGAPAEVRAHAGGFLVRSARAAYFLKLAGRPGMVTAEVRGLELLAATGAVRLPRVLAHRDDEGRAGGALLLEWVEAAPPASRDHQQAASQLGHALAALHRAGGPGFGEAHDGYIGAMPQLNGWHSSWLAFFGQRRLWPQGEWAHQAGLLGADQLGALARIVARLDTWIDERQVSPSLLHGDLWAGNWLAAAGGQPVLIDPAAYYGDREADLAMTSLFGHFPPAFYQAYEASWPLSDGWQERRDIYNLYHLLNHLNIFGHGYLPMVDALLRQYG